MSQSFHTRRPYFNSSNDLFIGILVVGLLIIVASTFTLYGFTTDEIYGHYRAAKTLDFVVSFGAVTKNISTVDPFNIYGAMPDVIALVLQKIFPSLSYDSRHLVSALFGVVGIYYVYRLGADFVNGPTGFFAALFLACNPMWFGYMFINLKDIPFAAMLLASSYYCVSAISGRYDTRWIWLKVAITTGLFASTKLTGLAILCFVVLVLLSALVFGREAGPARIARRLVLRTLMAGAAACLGCLVCFVFFWPEFYFFSTAELIRVVRLFANYNVWNGQVQINGAFFDFDKVPRYYMLEYFVISMPLFLVALIPVGLVSSIVRREAVVIAAASICITFFSYQAATRAQVYSGYRHFIFLLPFTSLIAAYPISLAVRPEASRLLRIAAQATVAVWIVVSAVAMYRIFPYQYSFYNSLVGGIQGADRLYYIDVWRSATREALAKLETIAQPGTVLVYSCGSALNFADHPRFQTTSDAGKADYIVALRRSCPPETFGDIPIVGDVRREGVIFATIHQRSSH